ncbi:unnamed protein product [Caenorhabditis sp. 36 PRJEB53466]|nr:unnamed protein product [Caenorhabditis sp. 36 PRJEB53466]
MPGLNEIPLHIKQRIYGELDFISRCNFRKSTRTNRLVSINSNFHANRLLLRVAKHFIEWKVSAKECILVKYNRDESGCRLETNIDNIPKTTKLIEGEHFVDLAFDDFEQMIGNRKLTVRVFGVEIHSGAVGYVENIKVVLEKLSHKLHVRMFDILFDGEHEAVLSFVPFMKPGILEHVCFVNGQMNSTELDLDDLLMLDQIKSARVLYSSRFETNTSVEKLNAIPHVSIGVQNLSPDYCLTLVTNFVYSETAECLRLVCKEMDVDALEQLLDLNFTRYSWFPRGWQCVLTGQKFTKMCAALVPNVIEMVKL